MSSESSPRIRRILLPLVALSVVALALPLVGGAVTLRLPKGVTKKQAYTMYAEQLDSQAAIEDLVAGEISQFYITKRTVTASSAALALDVRYKNGVRRRGTMRLFKVGDVWFMKSLTHHTDGTEHIGKVSTADNGVVNTILAEQVEYAPMSQKFVSGAYRRIVVGVPKPGYNSVEVPVTLAGAIGSRGDKGRITCIKKTVGGETVWFVTGFAK